MRHQRYEIFLAAKYCMTDLSAPGLHNFDISLIMEIVQFKYGAIPTTQDLSLLILTSCY
jgi:hypothetical protein